MRVVQARTAPNLFHNLLTRYDLAGVLRENLKDKIFLRTKGEPSTVERTGTSGEIDFKQPGSDDRIAGGRGNSGPQCRTRPGDQLPDTERLDDVIISPSSSSRTFSRSRERTVSTMIGMFDHDRSRSMIEEPSRSGRPRSRMMRSGGFSVADRKPEGWLSCRFHR